MLLETLILARISCYVATGNPMANGIMPRPGYVATSDRSLAFGTKIVIDGRTYEVGDRTNIRFTKFKLPTIDVYFESKNKQECINFGVKYKTVKIIKN